ncbi:MAG: Ig-like domain-containing protein [Candidatus Margulisbacteria bacterium]|nr:Ig-like domain-containing protein [Candidatus Margulisiibacteriota bacterium]MBU1021334.1 Ig-like domain-containing protein [Candidatus Margulisiibacteriota bacterium]MBU1729177.1 Ig-like domain-containing protein [Candidatus Margulisiibacteriota bacterium]MBU1954850.1 Ig-like domain-containing protein [Candidatus Margulisiibacteriota bacterium]
MKRAFLIIFGIMLLIFMIGCGRVISSLLINDVFPLDGAAGVWLGTTISAEFSINMDASTITTATFTVASPEGSVSGTITYNSASFVATFTPSANLERNVTYTATVHAGVKSADGASTLNSDHTWSFTTQPTSFETFSIDSVLGEWCGYGTSIALDSSQFLHVSYGQYTSPGGLRYNTNLTGTWVPVQVWSDTGGTRSTSIALLGTVPYIASVRSITGDLEYSDKSGGTWGQTIVDNSGNMTDVSLHFDSGSKPHITYWDQTALAIKHARNTSGTWETQNIVATSLEGNDCDSAIDSGDDIHISYYHFISGNLMYATGNWSGWTTTAVDSKDNVGQYTSIALDSSGNAHISYYDSTNGDLKYATNSSGSWVTLTIDDSADNAGGYTSIAVTSTGMIHISYYDFTNERLMYAVKDAKGWSTMVADAAAQVGEYTSIAVDLSGIVHITYYDETNRTIKYARSVN